MSCNRFQEIYKNLLNMYMVYSKSELFLKVKFWYQLNIQREKMVYGFRHLFLNKRTVYKTYYLFSSDIRWFSS